MHGYGVSEGFNCKANQINNVDGIEQDIPMIWLTHNCTPKL